MVILTIESPPRGSVSLSWFSLSATTVPDSENIFIRENLSPCSIRISARFSHGIFLRAFRTWQLEPGFGAINIVVFFRWQENFVGIPIWNQFAIPIKTLLYRCCLK